MEQRRSVGIGRHRVEQVVRHVTVEGRLGVAAPEHELVGRDKVVRGEEPGGAIHDARGGRLGQRITAAEEVETLGQRADEVVGAHFTEEHEGAVGAGLQEAALSRRYDLRHLAGQIDVTDLRPNVRERGGGGEPVRNPAGTVGVVHRVGCARRELDE